MFVVPGEFISTCEAEIRRRLTVVPTWSAGEYCFAGTVAELVLLCWCMKGSEAVDDEVAVLNRMLGECEDCHGTQDDTSVLCTKCLAKRKGKG